MKHQFFLLVIVMILGTILGFDQNASAQLSQLPINPSMEAQQQANEQVYSKMQDIQQSMIEFKRQQQEEERRLNQEYYEKMNAGISNEERAILQKEIQENRRQFNMEYQQKLADFRNQQFEAQKAASVNDQQRARIEQQQEQAREQHELQMNRMEQSNEIQKATEDYLFGLQKMSDEFQERMKNATSPDERKALQEQFQNRQKESIEKIQGQLLEMKNKVQ